MRNRYFLLADLFLFATAVAAAFLLRFDFLFAQARPEFWPFLGLVLVAKPAVFLVSGMYRRYWQSASLGELVVVVSANAASSFVLGLAVLAAIQAGVIHEFSRSVLLIDFMAALGLTGGLRFLSRVLAESHARTRKGGPTSRAGPRRVVIAGAGEAGALVARESLRNPQLGLEIAGFVDDDPVKLGKDIAGVRVLGALDAIEGIIVNYKLQEVVIALPSAPGRVVRQLVEVCHRLGVQSRIVPGVFELLSEGRAAGRLRKVEISDLLQRRPVPQRISAPGYLADRVVLVTGAGGSIGGELCRQVAAGAPRRLVLLGHGENSIFDIALSLRERFPGLDVDAMIGDIRDGHRVRQIFSRHRPDVVLHAAAHKHVPLMEANPEEAVTNNVIGTARILDAAITTGAERFVLVSSDKAVSPSSIMGASKRLAECVVQAARPVERPRLGVVRFGNVLGSRGSVVPLFHRQIAAGGPITITHPDVRRYFMTIPEAAHLVLEAAGFDRQDAVHVLNMGDAIPIVDLARDMVRLSGLDPEDVPIVFTGLRDGEKLSEALWEDDAQVEASPHPEVFRIVEPTPGWMLQGATSILEQVRRTDWLPVTHVDTLVGLCRRVVADTVRAEAESS